jgi:hypothetical protein
MAWGAVTCPEGKVQLKSWILGILGLTGKGTDDPNHVLRFSHV